MCCQPSNGRFSLMSTRTAGRPSTINITHRPLSLSLSLKTQGFWTATRGAGGCPLKLKTMFCISKERNRRTLRQQKGTTVRAFLTRCSLGGNNKTRGLFHRMEKWEDTRCVSLKTVSEFGRKGILRINSADQMDLGGFYLKWVIRLLHVWL